jgi:lipopolysaccharide biosynthesis regulator YciM
MPFFISDRGFFKPVRARYGSARMYQEGMKLIEEGNTHGALAILRRAIKEDYVEDVIPQLARFHIEVGDLAEATALLDEFIERAGATPDALEIQGDIFWEQASSDLARKAWESAIELRASSSLHARLARLHQSRGESDLAVKHDALSDEWHGVEAYRANDLESARQSLEKVIAKTPRRARAWFHLGLVYHGLGMKAQAISALENCLEWQPHHGRAKQMKAIHD